MRYFGKKTYITANVIQCVKNDKTLRFPYCWTCTTWGLDTFQEYIVYLKKKTVLSISVTPLNNVGQTRIHLKYCFYIILEIYVRNKM